MQHEGHIHAGTAAGSFFSRIFDADFVPRSQCYNQDPQVIGLHFVSDLIIALSYFSIPVALVYLVMKRRDLVFNWMFVLFGGFILLCGTTHVFNIIALWMPIYRLDGVVKAVTALFSIGTAVALWPLIPKALALPSQAALKDANTRLTVQIRERETAQASLQRTRDELERRVEERTAELADINARLAAEVVDRKQAEEQVRSLNQTLEERVRERTSELQQANQELDLSHQRLRLSERMAAIGTLSAGLGHDMGNLLLPVRARLEAMESRLADAPEDLREDVRAIRTCSDYLTRLAKGLRLLSLDPEEGGEEATDISSWWEDTKPMLENAVGRNIELTSDFIPGLPPLRVARHGLTQAVFNLVQNSSDVLRATGGRVTVFARHGPAGDVEIGVADNGPGMTEQVRQRCLEPFFTTKTRGISTGLGLTLVHGIIQRAGGTMDVQSSPGRGCSIALRFKAAPQQKGSSGEPRTARVAISDLRMRSYTASVLQSMGYKVAADGEPASPDLLVIEPSPTAEPTIREFLASNVKRRVVVLGPIPGLDSANILTIPDPTKPGQVRQVLHTAASA